MARRSHALSVLGGGVLLIVAARLIVPTAPPLYDGIVPIEPYLWLDPPTGDPGGAKGATADIAVRVPSLRRTQQVVLLAGEELAGEEGFEPSIS